MAQAFFDSLHSVVYTENILKVRNKLLRYVIQAPRKQHLLKKGLFFRVFGHNIGVIHHTIVSLKGPQYLLCMFLRQEALL